MEHIYDLLLPPTATDLSIPQILDEEKLLDFCVDFTYNTNAIEGSTVDLSEVRELPHLLSVKLIFSLIAALLIFWILYLISAIFVKNSYYSIAHHTGVDLFHTTGLLYLIGAATLIIFIGAIIIFIAKILEIIAFFSLPEELPKQEL